ncbi:phage integrase N-terminal SAM-like domain-containing protein [Carboxylicivirga sp. RSCT41]|uniref:phage integrase N-terminal SAM-like domain-containing protein n=1 Tax=Carboxylicivirga agarovorans TaxID=3417570 RepID=UPI003D33F8EC
MQQRPTIYLNHRESKHGDLCVLLFKKSNAILRRIRQNGWIKWHPEIRAYAAPSGVNAIGHIIDVFEDIADVNSSYLHAKLKENAEQVTIGDTHYFKGILEKIEKHGSVTLVPVKNEHERFIVITFKNNKNTFKLLKECEYTRWHNELRAFVIIPKRRMLIGFLEQVTTKLRVKIHNELSIVDYQILQLLFEQAYRKDIYFKSCPIKFIKFMHLKVYSMNTVNTYYYYVLRLLNCYRQNSLEQINAFNSDVINDYHQKMIGEKAYSEQTINQSINAVKLYYKGLFDVKTYWTN